MSNASDFVIDNGVLTKYVGPGGDVVIPDRVTQIKYWAFYDCKKLTSVVIPDSVTSIGRSAFCNCTNLTSVTIPDSVTSIDSDVFSGCTSLTSVTIPDSATSIGNSMFYGCKSLTNITIPDSVTSIGDRAFFECNSLTSVIIPAGVMNIGRNAFFECTTLTSITISDGCESIGEEAFAFCERLEKVHIPASVQTIDTRAFTGCRNLKEIVLQEGLRILRYRAFADCESLESASLPDSLERMGYSVFSGCPNIMIQTNSGSYAEQFLQAEDDNPASRKERKFQEWRKFFYFSMRSKGAYVTGCYADAPLIYLPDHIGKAQAIYAKDAFQEDVAFLCSEEVFKKLPLSNKYSTVREFLHNNEAFSDTEREYLSVYAKKNQTAMISYYCHKADYNTVRLLAKIKKITQATMDKLLAEFDDAETRMMLLVIKNEEQD